MTRIRIATLTAAVVSLAACNDNDPTALARVDQVILSPADTTVEHPDSFRYRVTLLDEDGDPIDDGIDRPMNFGVVDQSLLNVSDGGFVTTEDAGGTTISAQVGGTTGTATITITDALPD